MNEFKIEFTPSPNYRKGRKGRKIIAIVNHITAGLMPGSLSWLQNPAAKVSAHFLVTKAGQIYQLVKEEDTAFAAGIVNQPAWPLYDGTNPNYYTLNIEHEALAGEGLTDIQYAATLWLHRYLAVKWSIPADLDHIIGHYRLDSINRKNDPGPGFPWDKLMADLNQLSQENQKVSIKIGNYVIEGLLLENRAYAPVRELIGVLGGEITWDNNTRTIFISDPVRQHSTTEPSDNNDINIVLMKNITRARLIGDKAFAPVRELCETLGKKVTWDGKTATVVIS